MSEGRDLKKTNKGFRKTKTLIERIFFEIVNREMSEEERRVLLVKPKQTGKRKEQQAHKQKQEPGVEKHHTRAAAKTFSHGQR
jgi:hypothetical protein